MVSALSDRLRKHQTTIALVCFVASIAYLLCFRPIIAHNIYMKLDDQCYINWLARVFGFPQEGCEQNPYPPGVVLAWFPAFLGFWIIHLLSSLTYQELMPIMVGVLSFAYWVSSLALLIRIIQETFPKERKIKNFSLALFILFATPVFYYSTHRTTLIHSAEFFFSVFLIRNILKEKIKLVLCCAILLTLLRVNDAPTLIIPIGMALDQLKKKAKTERKQIKATICAALFHLLSFLIYAYWLAFIHHYHHSRVSRIIHHFGFNRFKYVLFALDWGLVYTGAWWLYCLSLSLYFFKKLSWTQRTLVFWCFSQLIICIGWYGNGSDFGYRYLIGSYAGTLILWFYILKNGNLLIRKIGSQLLILSATINFLMCWPYKETGPLTPFFMRNLMWSNLEQIPNTLLFYLNPENIFIPLRHSPLAAIYYTVKYPPLNKIAHEYALTGNNWEMKLIVTCILTAASIITLFVSSIKLYKIRHQLWSKS